MSLLYRRSSTTQSETNEERVQYSYWDWLPVEVQEHILTITRQLEELDLYRISIIAKYLPQLKRIQKLNEMWTIDDESIGLVTYKISKCGVQYFCDSRVLYDYYKKAKYAYGAHAIIISYRFDEEYNEKRKIF